MKNMENAHVIELPESGSFKAVQVYVNELPYLPFNYMAYYHKDILKKFLESSKIEFETESVFGKTLPSLKGKNYKVVGMGDFYISGKKLVFGGDSFDYSIGINPEHIEKCKPFFNNKDLEIIV